ncbi:uncharacterized protein LOC132799647 [Ziziphus jujuba]|uniref:Uncharacterized protein LOC132799647 n=1 Tax=Ziziphus jujuba TaxID=326968 RepID=A0ABM3ZU91_ZIZJJ|nr:uncharacterized protein LOC132799647 [Ziziphus jujuba]
MRSARYCILEGKLYRRSYLGPLLKCLGPAAASKVMAEVHEGHYGNHSRGRALARKIRLHGFYWPTLVRDCERFSPLRVLISDNGSQFISKGFRDLYKEWKIKLQYSSPRHPQGNGQTEVSNKSILNTLKKRLEDSKGLWVEEFQGVL